MAPAPTRFRVYVGMLQDPSIPGSSFVGWTEITESVMNPELEISSGLSNKASLFDFEAPNITLTLWGNFGYGIATGAFTIRPYSPIRIDVVGNDWFVKTKFRGFVSPDGVTVDEEFEDFPITNLLVMSYAGALKDVMLGSLDVITAVPYRTTDHGLSNQDPNEIAALYIKKGPWDVPGVTSPDHPSINNAEVALTPSQFHSANFLIPGDAFLFKRTYLFDSAMLTNSLRSRIDGSPFSTSWRPYTYNEHEFCAIRFTESEEPFTNLPIYVTPTVTLSTILHHICWRMNAHFTGFPFYNSLWPQWRHPYNDTTNPPPNLLVPGSIPLNVARCWHFRYLRVNNQDWLIVWHTQFEVEVYLVGNNSECEPKRVFTLESYLTLCSFEFYLYYYALWRDDPESGMFLSSLWESPIRRTSVAIAETILPIHPDWEAWDNVFCVVANRYIVFGNLKAVRWHRKYHNEHNYETDTNFCIAVFDTQDSSIHTRTDTVRYGTGEFGEVGTGRSGIAVDSTAIQKGAGGNDWYWIPTGCSGCRSDTIEHLMEDIWDQNKWDYEVQHVSSSPNYVGQEVGGRGAVWTDGILINGVGTIQESSPISEGAIGTQEGASYTRQTLGLTFCGDIALDRISFSFENMTCSEMLKLLCVLTDTIPVFDHNEQNYIDLILIPRQSLSDTVRTFSIDDLLSPLSREQWQYLSVDVVPSIDIPGLNISEEHRAALKSHFQKTYFLSRHELTTMNLSFMEDIKGLPPPSWLPDTEIGETVELSGRKGNSQNLGMIESIKISDYHISIVARRRY